MAYTFNPDLPASTYAEDVTPTFNADTGAIDHSRRQRQTGTEKVFGESLVAHLKANDFSGTIAMQEYLICPLRKRGLSPGEKRQLRQIHRRYANASFTIRRPDFFIEKYGLVIEIDGSVHDSSDSRILRDNTRDVEYSTLGLSCYVVLNRQAFDAEVRATVIQEILKLLSQEGARPDARQRYQCRRQAISRARREFQKLDSALDIGSFERQPTAWLDIPEMGHASEQWGGYRIELKPSSRIRHPKTRTSPGVIPIRDEHVHDWCQGVGQAA